MSRGPDSPTGAAPPDLALAFEARVTVGTALELGVGQGVRRRIIPITGGTVAGPRLTGKVLPGGADWQVIRADGLTEVVARYVIQADDGALIQVVNSGLRRAPPDVMRQLMEGQRVDPALVYFRTTPVFHPPDGPHAWLGRSIFLAHGERQPDLVVIRVFEVL